jgi:hypothetical protein
MANMSYCRFNNTLQDLWDCYYNMDDNLGEREASARRGMIELCRDIVEEYSYLLEKEEETEDRGSS